MLSFIHNSLFIIQFIWQKNATFADEVQLKAPPGHILISKPLDGSILICKLKKLTVKDRRSAPNALRPWQKRNKHSNFKNSPEYLKLFFYLNLKLKIFLPCFLRCFLYIN